MLRKGIITMDEDGVIGKDEIVMQVTFLIKLKKKKLLLIVNLNK